jgi:ABC-2 type transport system permease protein
MVKTAVGNIGVWHLISSMAALIAAFLFFIWLGGKIYRVGILSYGKKVTYKDLWKWIRQPN